MQKTPRHLKTMKTARWQPTPAAAATNGPDHSKANGPPKMLVLGTLRRRAHPSPSSSSSSPSSLSSSSSSSSTLAAAAAAPPKAPATVDDLPVEVLELVLASVVACGGVWALAQCAQTCRRWRQLCHDPRLCRLWEHARFRVHNPMWRLLDARAPRLRCFYTLQTDARAQAVYYLTAAQQQTVRLRRLRRLLLVGPNIHKGEAHMARLAAEAPHTHELVLQRAELTPAALRVVATQFAALRTLVLSEWADLDALDVLTPQTAPQLRKVVLHACAVTDRRLLVLAKHLAFVPQLQVSQCARLTPDGRRTLPQRFAHLVVDDYDHGLAVPVACLPALPAAPGASMASSFERPWHDKHWWSDDLGSPASFDDDAIAAC